MMSRSARRDRSRYSSFVVEPDLDVNDMSLCSAPQGEPPVEIALGRYSVVVKQDSSVTHVVALQPPGKPPIWIALFANADDAIATVRAYRGPWLLSTLDKVRRHDDDDVAHI